ncbi:MAG: ion transporter [Verrucomicrobiota bacterium]|nr:ion transporter [Limisphaera sp.]MDW8380707.1 ion transporter [Verrucomicrobiota bacterium]
MGDLDLRKLEEQGGVAPWRLHGARWIESASVQAFLTGVIVLNAVVLGLETSPTWRDRWGPILVGVDRLCLLVFTLELGFKMCVYRSLFWRSGWNWFDTAVVGIALIPAAGPWAVLRSLRVLRVLRLLTILPQLRRVVAAFLHAIPGLVGVILIMAIFYYTAGVLATSLFGSTHPQWFGTLGRSLYTLFQIMTLESWSMGIVRPVMEVHPWAWAFFVPYIVIATFTILNLFIGIIVSTMQELATLPDPGRPAAELKEALTRLEADVQSLRACIERVELESGDATLRRSDARFPEELKQRPLSSL